MEQIINPNANSNKYILETDSKISAYDLKLKELETKYANTIREKDALISQKESLIREKDNSISQKESLIRQKDNSISQKESLIREKDNIISQKESLIRQKDNSIYQKESLIREKDNIISQKESLIREKNSNLSQEYKYKKSLTLLLLRCYRDIEYNYNNFRDPIPILTKIRSVIDLDKVGPNYTAFNNTIVYSPGFQLSDIEVVRG